ncbi:PhoH family protein [Desulfotalea psychrophila]|nr:PhoH family protein [Desulfotalea psychrophila]
MKAIQEEISFKDNQQTNLLYGEHNCNIRTIEHSCSVTIKTRGTQLNIEGMPHSVELAGNLLRQLYALIGRGHQIYSSDVAFGIQILESSPQADLAKIFLDKVYVTTENRIISPKTTNQKFYIDEIRNKDIVFGIGPAGTGKTYLAVAMAVSALASGLVRSIILTRPAVEAGEKLGFLPGDLANKVDPYLRPIYDALQDMLGLEKTADLIERGVIEVAPLAFMRGRTLSNAFVILDEAQNTTREQMKMFLTRIGFDSQAIITGDVTQVDLPNKEHSGLLQAEKLLAQIKDIGFCHFDKADVVRHPLVQKIIHAYEQEQKEE